MSRGDWIENNERLTVGDLVSILIMLMAMLLLLLVFNDDAETYDAIDARYQDMVCEGSWPNYKQIELNCNQENEDERLPSTTIRSRSTN